MDLITSIPLCRPSRGDDLDYLKACVDSWRKHRFRIVSLNRGHEANHVEQTFGLSPIIFRDSEQSLYPGKFGPTFGEIKKHFRGRSAVSIINADAYILQNLDLTELANLCQTSFLFARRVEIPALNAPFHSIYRSGVDFIAFKPDLIPNVLHSENISSFKLGLVYWDHVLPIAASFFVPVRRIREPFILHRMHPNNLTTEIYDVMRVRAFEALRHFSRLQSTVSAAAREFEIHTQNLNMASRNDRNNFSHLCFDWLAGRVGPIEQIGLPFVDTEVVAKMLGDSLDQLACARELAEQQSKHAIKYKAKLDKAHGAVAKLRDDIRRLKDELRGQKPSSSWRRVWR